MVTDIHGNLTALEAVIADLREAAPDLVLQGGDVAAMGSSPAEVVDRVREVGWPGVAGNADEMLYRPEALAEFAGGTPRFQPLVAVVEAAAAAVRDRLGAERLAWLAALPAVHRAEGLVLVHATPCDLWRSPAASAPDEELLAAYGGLGPLVVYGHIHVPFVRQVGSMMVVNAGSAGMPYDGDRRASYLLVDDGVPTIRRVGYDLEREKQALSASGLPYADWVGRTLEIARPQMP